MGEPNKRSVWGKRYIHACIIYIYYIYIYIIYIYIYSFEDKMK